MRVADAVGEGMSLPETAAYGEKSAEKDRTDAPSGRGTKLLLKLTLSRMGALDGGGGTVKKSVDAFAFGWLPGVANPGPSLRSSLQGKQGCKARKKEEKWENLKKGEQEDGGGLWFGS